MGFAIVGIVTLIALLVTLQRGAVMAFVWLWLPCQLLLYLAPRVPVPSLPDISPPFGVLYGIMLGLVLKGGERLPFRWNLMDTLILLITLSDIVSYTITEKVWTGVAVLGDRYFEYVAPYFMARIMFHSAQARRHALWIIVVICLFVAACALVEVRLIPLVTARTLKGIGLFHGVSQMVLERWGLFRTQVLYCHPIDMGNSSILLVCFMIIFATTTSVGLKNFWVLLGICAALGSVFTTLSFTSYAMLIATTGLAVVMLLSKFISRSMAVFVVCAIIAGVSLSYRLYSLDLSPMESNEDAPEVQNSMYIRAKIVQNSWPFASTAGWFGYGNKIRKSDLDLDSVDNTYMLLIMRRGWVYLCLFLLIPFQVTLRAARALGRVHGWPQRLPVTIAMAGVLGTMVAMYTVWFGFIYSALWVLMVATFESMTDVILYGPPAQALPSAERAAPVGATVPATPALAGYGAAPPRRLVPSRSL
jgi:hypothetical protein